MCVTLLSLMGCGRAHPPDEMPSDEVRPIEEVADLVHLSAIRTAGRVDIRRVWLTEDGSSILVGSVLGGSAAIGEAALPTFPDGGVFAVSLDAEGHPLWRWSAPLFGADSETAFVEVGAAAQRESGAILLAIGIGGGALEADGERFVPGTPDERQAILLALDASGRPRWHARVDAPGEATSCPHIAPLSDGWLVTCYFGRGAGRVIDFRSGGFERGVASIEPAPGDDRYAYPFASARSADGRTYTVIWTQGGGTIDGVPINVPATGDDLTVAAEVFDGATAWSVEVESSGFAFDRSRGAIVGWRPRGADWEQLQIDPEGGFETSRSLELGANVIPQIHHRRGDEAILAWREDTPHSTLIRSTDFGFDGVSFDAYVRSQAVDWDDDELVFVIEGFEAREILYRRIEVEDHEQVFLRARLRQPRP